MILCKVDQSISAGVHIIRADFRGGATTIWVYHESHFNEIRRNYEYDGIRKDFSKTELMKVYHDQI